MAEQFDLDAAIERAIAKYTEAEACECAEEKPCCEPAEAIQDGPKVSVQTYSGNSSLLTDSKSELSVSTYNGNAGKLEALKDSKVSVQSYSGNAGKLDNISKTSVSVQSYGGNAGVINPMTTAGDEGYTYARFNGKNAGEVPMGNWQKAKLNGDASTPGSAGGPGVPVPQGECKAGVDPMVEAIVAAVSADLQKNAQAACGKKDLFIAPSADVVGKVTLGHEANVWYQAVIRGDQEPITIGDRTNVQDGSVVHVAPGYPTMIGNGVTIGHNCTIHGCTIADNVLVGMSTTILNGAEIGENCIIGAKSLVTQNKKFPAGSLIMGSPAKVIRPLTAEEIASITANAEEYIRLMNEAEA